MMSCTSMPILSTWNRNASMNLLGVEYSSTVGVNSYPCVNIGLEIN